VLSVLYLAVQVHQSNRVARLATPRRCRNGPARCDQAFNGKRRVGTNLARRPRRHQCTVNRRAGTVLPRQLPILKAFETIHFHYVYGLMDKELWEGWHGLLRHYIFASGMAHY